MIETSISNMDSDSNNSLESEPDEVDKPQTDGQANLDSSLDSSNEHEDKSNVIDASSNNSGKAPISSGSSNDKPKPPPLQHTSLTSKLAKLVSRVNIYLVLFGLLILIGCLVALLAYTDSKNSSNSTNLDSKGLSASTLAQLANSDTSATVGSNGQILNVESSAVFAGQVLVRQGLDVAGNLSIGGVLALNDLTVSGTSQLQQAVVNKNLSVSGDSNLQGNATVNKNLQVGGSGTFSGAVSAPQITTSSLQLNGSLILDQHIITGGGIPSHSSGGALGSGGTVNLSGNDTAGEININTGNSPAAGCFITINFTSAFASAPYITVTPVGSSAGGISYYINRANTGFSICDAATPPANANFGFDYFTIG
jgi:cytoskeletal protein CcmA (bactofilin family)